MFSEFSKLLFQLQRAFMLKKHFKHILVILEHPWSSISDNNLNLQKDRSSAD